MYKPKYLITFFSMGGRDLDGFSENGATLTVYRVGRRCANETKLTKLGEDLGLNDEAFWPDTVIYCKAQYLIKHQKNLGTYVLQNSKVDMLKPHDIYGKFLTDCHEIDCTRSIWPLAWKGGK